MATSNDITQHKGLHGLIRTVHISEKSLKAAQSRTHTFVVSNTAHKLQIKKALEVLHGLKVQSINIMRMPGKPKSYGKTKGSRAEYKKAIVTLKPDSKQPDFLETT